MRHILGISAAVALIIVVALFSQPKANPTPTGKPTVKIVLERGHGSGVYIGNGLILTAAHVVVNSKDGNVKVKTEGGNILKGEVLWMSKARDVALVKVSGTFGLSPAVLSCSTPQIGDAIQARGNPLSVEFFSSWGHIAGTPREMGRWLEIVPTDLTVVMGMSGGPVFDVRGEVVGLVVGVMGAPMGISVSITGASVVVPGSAICPLLGR